MSPTRLALVAVLGLLCGACVADNVVRERRVPAGHEGFFETWWNDQQVREIGHYQQGLRHGEVVLYHPSGMVESAGNYERGLPVGEIRYYARTGELRLIEDVHDGVLHGRREEFDELGQLRRRVVFRAGRRHGLEQILFANGSLASEGAWTDDLPVGRWLHRDADGRLLSAETYWVAQGRLVGYLETTHHPETGSVTTQSLKTLRDDVWHGWRTRWHANGVQAGLEEYVNDLREGRDVSWDLQGRKVGEGRRMGDLRTGNWRFWDASGGLLEELRYVQGELVEGGSSG